MLGAGKTGLAFIGDADRMDLHRRLADEPGCLEFVGCRCEHALEQAEVSGIRCCSDPQQLIGRPDVEGVVICTPLEKRAFWCLQAAAAGKRVLCEWPPGERYGLVRQILACPGRLAVASPAWHSPAGQAIVHGQKRGLGRLLFFELGISVARAWLAGERQGVVLLGALDYLALIDRFCGPIDSVWARTRSLARNCAAEDMALVYLQCQDGREGFIHIDGMADADRVCLSLRGRLRSEQVVHDIARDGVQAWQAAYRRFASCQDEKEADLIDRGYRLMNWIHQAARGERTVYRKEVIL